MAKKQRYAGEWTKLTDEYKITPETFRSLRMKPGLSNVDIYINGPKDEIRLPDSVSPQTSRCWELPKRKIESSNGGEKRPEKVDKYT